MYDISIYLQFLYEEYCILLYTHVNFRDIFNVFAYKISRDCLQYKVGGVLQTFTWPGFEPRGDRDLVCLDAHAQEAAFVFLDSNVIKFFFISPSFLSLSFSFHWAAECAMQIRLPVKHVIISSRSSSLKLPVLGGE